MGSSAASGVTCGGWRGSRGCWAERETSRRCEHWGGGGDGGWMRSSRWRKTQERFSLRLPGLFFSGR